MTRRKPLLAAKAVWRSALTAWRVAHVARAGTGWASGRLLGTHMNRGGVRDGAIVTLRLPCAKLL